MRISPAMLRHGRAKPYPQGYGFFFWRKHEASKCNSRNAPPCAAGDFSDCAGSVRAGLPVRRADERAGQGFDRGPAGARHRAAEGYGSLVDAAAARAAGGARRGGAFRFRLRVPEHVRKSPCNARHVRRCERGELRGGIGAAAGIWLCRRAADGVLLWPCGGGADVPDGKGRLARVDDPVGYHDGLFIFRARFARQIHGGHGVTAPGHHLLAHGKPERGKLCGIAARRARDFAFVHCAAASAVEAESFAAV